MVVYRGQVDISLGHSPDEVVVIVKDDGVGLPTPHSPRLGLEIAQTLITDDLNGQLKFIRPASGGTEVSIRLPRTYEQGTL